jgi:hypothetical protein
VVPILPDYWGFDSSLLFEDSKMISDDIDLNKHFVPKAGYGLFTGQVRDVRLYDSNKRTMEKTGDKEL